MRAWILLWFAVFLTLTAHAENNNEASAYSQSYAIIIRGALAGNETVSEKRDVGGDLISTSEHEMLVSDGLETKRMTFATRMVLSKKTGIPSAYSYWYTSGNTGDSYEVTI